MDFRTMETFSVYRIASEMKMRGLPPLLRVTCKPSCEEDAVVCRQIRVITGDNHFDVVHRIVPIADCDIVAAGRGWELSINGWREYIARRRTTSRGPWHLGNYNENRALAAWTTVVSCVTVKT